MTDATVFSNTATPTDQPDSTALQSDFVGEGKKYADINAAIASIGPAQEHISTLEADNAALRAQVAEAAKVSELLEAMKTQQSTDTPTTPADNTNPQDISETVRTVLQEVTMENSAAQNIATADAAMKAKFGDKAQSIMLTKAAEVGLDVDAVKTLAAQSPQAFNRLMGLESTSMTQGEPTPTTSTTTTSTVPTSTNEGTQAAYTDILKADKRAFLSPEVQKRQMADAMANPEKYFNT